MLHTLTLEIPEDIYALLEKSAAETGTPVEELALQWLMSATRAISDDPLEQYIGVFSTDVPDWTERHDKYLGDTLLHEDSGLNSSGAPDA